MIQIVSVSDRGLKAFNARPAFPEAAERAAAEVLADIRQNGDEAVARYMEKFDGVKLKPAQFKLKNLNFSKMDKSLQRMVNAAYVRVVNFSKASLKKRWEIGTAKGGRMGEFFSPMDRVGVYVPGGTAPLASTAIMTVSLAKVAGVREIVACTPAGKDGSVNEVLLYALQLAGATEIYRVGGIQAIGMMAYGTKTCPKVQKIAGPGNAYVTAAKRQVYGYVAIDQVAGPSEIAILADGSVPASWVAADMLSQAEHGSGLEKSLCVCTSRRFAGEVEAAILAQAQKLGRKDKIDRVIEAGGIMIAVAKSVPEGAKAINDFAPEHLEIMTKNPLDAMRFIRSAGAIFLGPWTPESAGDFVAGPSHVLPTGGAANMFSGLTPDDFRRRHSYVQFAKADLMETLPVIKAFAGIEGLDAHGRSAEIRFE